MRTKLTSNGRPRWAAGGALFAVVSEIVDALVEAYESQRPINISRLKAAVASKHKVASMPRVRALPLGVLFDSPGDR